MRVIWWNLVLSRIQLCSLPQIKTILVHFLQCSIYIVQHLCRIYPAQRNCRIYPVILSDHFAECIYIDLLAFCTDSSLNSYSSMHLPFCNNYFCIPWVFYSLLSVFLPFVSFREVFPISKHFAGLNLCFLPMLFRRCLLTGFCWVFLHEYYTDGFSFICIKEKDTWCTSEVFWDLFTSQKIIWISLPMVLLKFVRIYLVGYDEESYGFSFWSSQCSIRFHLTSPPEP